MNLEAVAQSFLEQYPAKSIPSIDRREKLLERLGIVAFTGFGIVLTLAIGALIYLIITKMILNGENFWSGRLILAFVLFAGLSLAYVFFNEILKEKKQKIAASILDEAIDPAPPLLELREGNFVPAASVIEETTDLLPVEPKSGERI
ncbi:MAG: hypothetical protein LC730_01120 [Acidobacteria bacterium]|nr:hypothetical protein [Acidobacteriota bacterium]MCA1608049.1 hypothetical protein [Acidobacteriota bacterium]